MFKSKEKIISHYKKIRNVDGVEFTAREIDVISCIINGRTSAKEIANLLAISPKVVETYKSHINLKLKGNVNLNIRDFLEKSSLYETIRSHYFSLCNEYNFRDLLKKIANNSIQSEVQVTIVCGDDNIDKEFIGHGKNIGFKSYLEQAGIPCNVSKIQDFNDVNKDNIVIYILNDNVANYIIKQENDNNAQISHIKNHIFYVVDEANLSAEYKQFSTAATIIFNENYYESFCKLLLQLKIYDNKSIELINAFLIENNNYLKKQHVGLSVSNTHDSNSIANKQRPNFLTTMMSNFKRKIFIMGLLVLSVFMTAYGVIKIQYPDISFSLNDNIYDELLLPDHHLLLERPAIINSIQESLEENNDNEIVAVALVGAGGAGKTTIARLYGKYIAKSSVVWELNAENDKTLIHSMLNLAYALADSVSLKQELSIISQQILDEEIRNKQLLNFVKLRLRNKPNWLLIYDNVENVSDIHHLFLHGKKQCGNGKIIITTRNTHIDKTSFLKPNKTLFIHELNDEDKLTLFVKILYNKSPSQVTNDLKDDIKKFLQSIPSFPLDVTLAGYVLKNTYWTLDEYLRQLQKGTDIVDDNLQYISQDTMHHHITRYDIVSSSIKKIIDQGAHYKDLFFVLCVLDSQNIPYKLLKLSPHSDEVDNFTYALGQHAIITQGVNEENVAGRDGNVHIHRSTHQLMDLFFHNTLEQQEKMHFLKQAIAMLQEYYDTQTDDTHWSKRRALAPHLEHIIKTATIMGNGVISNEVIVRAALMLAEINNKGIKKFDKAIHYYEQAIKVNESIQYFSTDKLAAIFRELGSLYETCNKLENAVEACEQSMTLLPQSNDSSDIIKADNLRIIGSVHRKLNDFDASLNKLNQAAAIAKGKAYDTESALIVAEIYTQLAALYLSKYLHRDEAKVAEEFFTEAFNVLEQYDISPCDTARFKWKYARVQMFQALDYQKTITLLNEALEICNTKCREDIYLQGRIYGFLGGSLLRGMEVERAERLLNQSITLIHQVVGPNARRVEYIRRAEAKIMLGRYEQAYEDCKKVFGLKLAERNNLFDLILYINLYHAGFIKYKLSEYESSIEHFGQFITSIEEFCKDFLDLEIYESLKEMKVFEVIEYNEQTALQDIHSYLKNSVIIFKHIYGEEHGFVSNYIVKNAEDI